MISEMDRILYTELLNTSTAYYHLVPAAKQLENNFSAGLFGRHAVALLSGIETPYIGCMGSFTWFLGSYPLIHISYFALTKIKVGFLLTKEKAMQSFYC